MKSWPLILALLGAPAAVAESPLELVEHAPMLRLDRGGPPEPGRSYGRPDRRSAWSTAALPGGIVQLALWPVDPEAPVVARVEGQDVYSLDRVAGLVPQLWSQSSTMVPGDRSEDVAEVLGVPPGTRQHDVSSGLLSARPMDVRLVHFVIPEGQPAGWLGGSVSIGGRPRIDVRIRVLEPLPPASIDPVLAFYRGRLVDAGETAWPEQVDRSMLRDDLSLMREVGVTHVTYYGSVESLDLAREIWRDAGLATEPLLLGWYPGSLTRVEPEQAREAVRLVEELRVSDDGAPRAFWTVDEPIREELQLARRKAALIREGGGLSTATVQSETAPMLRHDIDLHLMDNYLTPRPVFDEAVRSVREAGSTPWGYWQSWGESARFARWNAGFRQLDEPTRGQSFYAYAHANGDPFDDFDAGYKDMLMVYPVSERTRLETLQWLGLRLGLEDLRIARGAQALVREAKLDGIEHRSVSRLERELERARRRWSSARADWGRYSWEDVARPGEGGPPAAALERTRQRILKAVADLQAARAETFE